MLQLLLERGQTYDDLAGLLGIETAEVRRRARAALTELGGSDPDADVGLTDYLLGQADPIGRADAVRHLQREPAARSLAGEILTKLAILTPNAELPQLDASGPIRAKKQQPVKRAATSATSPLDPEPSRSGLDPRQTRIFAALGLAGLIALVLILAIAGVFSSDDQPSDSTDQATAAGPNQSAVDPTGDSSRIVLTAAKPGGPAGQAIFGRTDTDQAYLDLRVSGLPQPTKDKAVLAWFVIDTKQAGAIGFPFLPLDAIDANGGYSDRRALNPSLGGISQAADGFVISLTDRSDLAAVVQEVAKQAPDSSLIPFVGEALAEGLIVRSDDATSAGGSAGESGSSGAAADASAGAGSSGATPDASAGAGGSTTPPSGG